MHSTAVDPRFKGPVSAAIPCHNAAPWLRAAIESVLGQTRRVDELIVVDDASTDASAAIASEYPIRLIRMPVNRGPSAARNLALREAAHDRIAWLDADDYWDAHHCAVVVSLLDAHPEAAVAFSSVREVGTRRGVWARPMTCAGPTRVLWDCFAGTIVPATSVVTRRQPALDVGGFREEIRSAEDFDFWLRLALTRPFVWTREVTAAYRRHDRQNSENPLAQQVSMHRSRVRVAGEVEAAGDAGLAARMREGAREMLDADARDAWWRGDMRRLRALLVEARAQGVETIATRRFRRVARVPAPCIQGWRRLQALWDAGGHSPRSATTGSTRLARRAGR